MWRHPSLPFLPGNAVHFPEDGARSRWQVCTFRDGIAVVDDPPPLNSASGRRPPTAPAPVAADDSCCTTCDRSTSTTDVGGSAAVAKGRWWEEHSRSDGIVSGASAAAAGPRAVPAWVAFDRKVLGFRAYFVEELPGEGAEPWRVRRCWIYMYLEDGSLEVVEPPEQNSGLNQGRFLRRHRVPRPGGAGGFLSWRDLTVGGAVDLYSRRFHIVGCDGATRRWLQEQGVLAGPEEAWPEGPHDAARRERASRDQQQQNRSSGALGAGVAAAAGHTAGGDEGVGGGVLRFYGVHDTATHSSRPATPREILAGGRRNSALAALTGGAGGELLPLAVHFYPSDGTFEVVELLPKKGGKDPFPRLLHRSRLPRTLPSVGARPMGRDERSRDGGAADGFYGADDLHIGAVIHVYNRPVLLTDMDPFTKRWYCRHHGVSPEALAPIPVDLDCHPRRPPTAPPPNELPIGDEEDTLANANRLVPRPVPRDYAKWEANDRKALRFVARLAGPLLTHFDADRRFVLSFFPADDTLSVYEPPRRNSGLPGGMFAERARVRRPGGGPLDIYRPADMAIGTTVSVHGRRFTLEDADEATLKTMEADPTAFPIASPPAAARLLRSALAAAPPGAVMMQLQQRLAEIAAGLAGVIQESSVQSGTVRSAAIYQQRQQQQAQQQQQLQQKAGTVTARQLHEALLLCGAVENEPTALHAAVTLVRALASDCGGSSNGGLQRRPSAQDSGSGRDAGVPAAADAAAAPVAAVTRALGLGEAAAVSGG